MRQLCDTIRRYSVLYAHIAVFSLKRSLEFRIEFLFSIVMDLAYAAAAIGAYAVVYGHTTLLSGWSYEEIQIFVAAWLFVDGLQMVFVNRSLAAIPNLINKGDLDYYLIRPVSALFMVSVSSVGINSVVNLMLWCVYLAWSLHNYPGPLSPLHIVVFIALLCNGAFLYYLTRMCFLLSTFWLQSALGMETLFFTLIRCGERPDDIFGRWLRRALVSFVPFALMASVPSKILLGKVSLVCAFYVGLISASLFALLVLAWRISLRHYGSASS